MAIESTSRYAASGIYECTCPLSVESNQILSSLFDQEMTCVPGSSDGEPQFREIAVFSSQATSQQGNNSSQSSSKLIPGIQSIVKRSKLQFDQLDLVAVSLGPGSFTGIRLGVVTAKTIGYSTKCKVVGVNLFDVLAWQAVPHLPASGQTRLSCALNIGRGDVLVAEFKFDGTRPELVAAPQVAKPDAWIEGLEKQTLINGNAIDLLSQQQREGFALVPEPFRTAQVASVAKLGLINFAQNGPDDVWSLEPIYSRPSAAEEVRNRK